MGPHLLTESQARAAFPADVVVVRPPVSWIKSVTELVFVFLVLAAVAMGGEWIARQLSEQPCPPESPLFPRPSLLIVITVFYIDLVCYRTFYTIRRYGHANAWFLAVLPDNIWLNMNNFPHIVRPITDKTVLQLDHRDISRVCLGSGSLRLFGRDILRMNTAQIWLVLREPLDDVTLDSIMEESTKVLNWNPFGIRLQNPQLQVGKDLHHLCLSIDFSYWERRRIMDLLNEHGIHVDTEARLDTSQLRPNLRKTSAFERQDTKG